MSLRLIHAGACTLLVDGGRPRSRSLGIPLGGAADRGAWKIANALIGNPPETVTLEIALAGPHLIAEKSVSLALFGAPFRMERDGVAIPTGTCFHLRCGQTLKIGPALKGCRAYLAVAGGIQSPEILASHSSFTPLQNGTILETFSIASSLRSLPASSISPLLSNEIDPGLIRILPGPQHEWFDSSSWGSRTFRVSPASNRMGIRLEGEVFTRSPREMISEPVAPGAIQITNEGLPIILGVDGQTIGGYPKIAHVIRADLDRLAQLQPHEVIRFQRISIEEAENESRNHQRRVQEWLTRLQIADRIPARF